MAAARSAWSRTARLPGGERRALTVRARATVVACGSLLTPLLLEASGVGTASGQLGRNLSIHPALGVMALFDEKLDGGNAIPQGYAIEQFHDEGILFEGAFAPLDLAAASFTMIGPRFVELVEAYDRLACFGVMIEDVSRGRVRRGPGGRPLITYSLVDHDVARLKRAVEILGRVYFAAGARSVLIPWCTASTSCARRPTSSGCVAPGCARATSRSAPITRSAPRAWGATRRAASSAPTTRCTTRPAATWSTAASCHRRRRSIRR